MFNFVEKLYSAHHYQTQPHRRTRSAPFLDRRILARDEGPGALWVVATSICSVCMECVHSCNNVRRDVFAQRNSALSGRLAQPSFAHMSSLCKSRKGRPRGSRTPKCQQLKRRDRATFDAYRIGDSELQGIYHQALYIAHITWRYCYTTRRKPTHKQQTNSGKKSSHSETELKIMFARAVVSFRVDDHPQNVVYWFQTKHAFRWRLWINIKLSMSKCHHVF